MSVLPEISLPRAPRLMPALAKGAVTGMGKRPRADAPLPAVRLTLPGVRADAARTAAYAEVCGFGAPGPVLPVTYPHILGFPLAARLMSARSFPLPMLGLVHTTIEIAQHAPLYADRPLDLTVYAQELRPHRRGTEAVLVTEARRGGELVWEDRSTYLARHRTEATASTPPPDDPATPELPFCDEWKLAADLGRRHAAVSGDYNPIHLHPLTARALGFPRALAHGMWTIARCAAEAVPADAPAVHLTARFRAPVLLPATVTYGSDGHAFRLGSRSGRKERIHLEGNIRIPG
ncbi:MaoC family dehydratase [Streptomyces ochraceiscleroticus]|uniref:MaoC family dehydratase n=1 Tax=Streptomyces ochraceiscleroticus TaxID=47761 RepID=A0ABW1MVQ7_9ACTN|nr:MaoC family dehydratase [Streptomyces ochraceiscleroticus]